MVPIRQKLVSDAVAAKVTYGKGNKKTFIVVHETDNARSGADADAHSRLQSNGNSRQASWHYQVDSDEIVQSFLHDYRCWAAGNSKGNNEGIQVEICVNSDGDYQKAVRNAAALVAKIMRDENIPINRVVQHNFFSGKNCPKVMRSGRIPFAKFIQMVNESIGLTVAASQPDTKLYRILTGTYKTREQAENIIDVMKHRFGWTVYLVDEGSVFRVRTGTFKGKTNAEKASDKVKAAKLATTVYINVA